jgi:hypothetical protein
MTTDPMPSPETPAAPGPEAEPPSTPSPEAPEAPDPPPTPSNAEYSVAFSPRQVAVGLAIVAALIAMVIGRRRGRKAKDGD